MQAISNQAIAQWGYDRFDIVSKASVLKKIIFQILKACNSNK
jgi:hypothetical protein